MAATAVPAMVIEISTSARVNPDRWPQRFAWRLQPVFMPLDPRASNL